MFDQQKAKFNRRFCVGVLPDSLTSLCFSDAWNQPLEVGVLPLKLEKLKFGARLRTPVSASAIPSCVREIRFGYLFDLLLSPGAILSSVISVTFESCGFLQPGIFSVGVRGLSINSIPDQPLKPIIFPATLEKLWLGSAFEDKNLSVGCFPPSLKHLTSCHDFESSLEPGVLPHVLEYLSI